MEEGGGGVELGAVAAVLAVDVVALDIGVKSVSAQFGHF